MTAPFAEGGGSDMLVRAPTSYLKDRLAGNPTILARNEPGGGGIPSTNRFVRSTREDGADIFAMSTSLFLAKALASPQITFKLSEFAPVFIAPMGAVLFVSPSTGAKGPGDVEGLKDAKLIKGVGRQDSADILSILQLDLLGLDIKPVRGMERGAGRIGVERGEFNVDHQSAAACQRDVKPLVDEGKAVPFMTGGAISPSGAFERDPTFPEIPTFVELYEKVHGKPLGGPALRAYTALMSAAITTGKAIVLPAAAPQEIITAYSEAFARIVADPAFRAANESSLGSYPLYTGADARALRGALDALDEEAFAWLADWRRTKIGFERKQ